MADEKSILNNLEIHKDFVIASINPKLYPLSIIFSAAYALLDRAHIIIDGDPNTEILVELKRKNKEESLEELGRDFNDELVNYVVYMIQSIRNKKIREDIMENALKWSPPNSVMPRPDNMAGPQNRPAGVTGASPMAGQQGMQGRQMNSQMPRPGQWSGEAGISDPEGILRVKAPSDAPIDDPENIFKSQSEQR